MPFPESMGFDVQVQGILISRMDVGIAKSNVLQFDSLLLKILYFHYPFAISNDLSHVVFLYSCPIFFLPLHDIVRDSVYMPLG